jgi:hypothetical protein
MVECNRIYGAQTTKIPHFIEMAHPKVLGEANRIRVGLPIEQTSGSAPHDVVIGPWLENLVEQYQNRPSHTAIRLRLPIILATVAALSPLLVHFDRQAYPTAPEKRKALEVCARSDPTFVRFFAGDRAACYDRYHGLIAHAAADLKTR